jgi:hypothetical protein
MWLWATIALSVIAIAALVLRPWERRRAPMEREDPLEIESLDSARRAELIRGTSLHLRDMRFRYSIRPDRGDRAPFTATVNTIRLGFVPVIIADNASERQGQGYAAFVHDGRRWCGPGLPCAGSPREAVDHATRCVAPLDRSRT